MIQNIPPLRDTPRGSEPVCDTGAAMPNQSFDQQIQRRLNGVTALTETMMDVVDLVQTMDHNRIQNMAVKNGRDDLRGN